MNNSRILGNNIRLELNRQNCSLSTFAQKTGLSERESHKLVEGRLFIPPFQLRKIAETLNISVNDLITDRGNEEYNQLIHNFRDFKNPANQELVLDLIDMYADLEEALV